MCGIIGATGGDEVLGVLLQGLERLEYRGYDSAGVALQSEGVLWRARAATGTRSLEDLRKVVEEGPGGVAAGIGHTRWATHGHPTEANAHPHPRLHRRRRRGAQRHHRELAGAGRRSCATRATSSCPTPTPRSSPTWSRGSCRAGRRWPTPCAPRCARCGAPSPWRSMCAGEPGTIVAGRRVSPLIIGMGDGAAGEGLLASDIPALLGRTRRFWVLDDDQVVVLRPGSMRVTTLQGKEVEPKELHVDWDLEAAEKGGYPDFMGKEIHEQPRADRRHPARAAAARRDRRARRAPDHRRRAAPGRQGVHGGVRLELPRRHGGQVRHRALGPPAHRDRHRLGVPLPRPRARRADPRRRGEPVGRDHRHPPGHARGPPVGRQDHGDLQRGGLVHGP